MTGFNSAAAAGDARLASSYQRNLALRRKQNEKSQPPHLRLLAAVHNNHDCRMLDWNESFARSAGHR
jgi:hypothetical protein